MPSVNGHGHGPHGGHGLHQSALLAAGNVHEAGVIGRVVLGVVVAWLVILEKEEEEKRELDGMLWYKQTA